MNHIIFLFKVIVYELIDSFLIPLTEYFMFKRMIIIYGNYTNLCVEVLAHVIVAAIVYDEVIH